MDKNNKKIIPIFEKQSGGLKMKPNSLSKESVSSALDIAQKYKKLLAKSARVPKVDLGSVR